MTTNGDNRFAIIMAGGDGARLQPFVQELRQKALPKQYVNFIGRRSMLEHTIDRARKVFSADHIVAVVSQSHFDLPEARQQLANMATANVIAQPLNRGTWPGILLPLARIYGECPGATVVTFPADHFIQDEDVFLAHVAFAMRKVEEQPASMVLLGMTPDSPDSELGYIVPGARGDCLSSGLLSVKEFREKPSPEGAKKLMMKGALWNTLILVAKAKTLVHYTREIAPELHPAFLRMKKAIGPLGEPNALDEIYENIAAMDLSHGLLANLPQLKPGSLLTLPVEGVVWSDWGCKKRILSVLDRTGYRSHLHYETEARALAGCAARPRSTVLRREGVQALRTSPTRDRRCQTWIEWNQ